MEKLRKPFGIGTLSLPLILLGIFFAFNLFGICYGDIILNSMGLKAWSNGETGTHYTVFYSLLFFVPALLLAFKGKADFGAKIGKVVSVILVGVLLLSTLFLVI